MLKTYANISLDESGFIGDRATGCLDSKGSLEPDCIGELVLVLPSSAEQGFGGERAEFVDCC